MKTLIISASLLLTLAAMEYARGGCCVAHISAKEIHAAAFDSCADSAEDVTTEECGDYADRAMAAGVDVVSE